MRNDFQQILEDLQEHVLNRIKEEKDDVLEQLNSHIKISQDKYSRLEEIFSRDIAIIKDQFEQNRLLITEKLELLIQQIQINS